jgi:type IV secretory pathway VirB10-like protein
MNRRNFLQLLGAVVLSGMVDSGAAFALRRQREDEDRAVRLARMAQDHQAQLDAEFERALVELYDRHWAYMQSRGYTA